jgi:hypothetical protein
MKAPLKKLLRARVDPFCFLFVCLILLVLGIFATALADDVSGAYDPVMASLSLPTHTFP